MEIDKKLHDDIKAYCKLNGLKMTEYINKLLRQAFNVDKYGSSPFAQSPVTVIETPIPPMEINKVETVKIEEKKEEKETIINTEEDGSKVVKINRKRKLK